MQNGFIVKKKKSDSVNAMWNQYNCYKIVTSQYT